MIVNEISLGIENRIPKNIQTLAKRSLGLIFFVYFLLMNKSHGTIIFLSLSSEDLGLLEHFFLLVNQHEKTEEEQHQLLYLGFSIHQEVASDSFCFLINSSWLLVFILFLFLHALGLNLYCWNGIHFS